MLESLQSVLRRSVSLLSVAGALSYSALAPALGLGDITLHSALNQPLNAEIALVDPGALSDGELSVSLATADEFARAGVERVFFLNDLRFTAVLRGNRSVIRVVSSKPVNEPFLNFLVQANQPNGHLLREYTVLIDPPGSPGIVPVSDVEPAPAITQQPTATAPVKTPAAPPVSTAPATTDRTSELLAASVLENQQLKQTIDQLNTRLQAQDEQIASQRKQVSDLQTELAEAKKPLPAPVIPVVPIPVPTAAVDETSSGWALWLIGGLLVLGVLLLLGLFALRRRRVQPVSAPAPRHEPVVSRGAPDSAQKPSIELSATQSPPANRETAHGAEVLEGVGIYLTYDRYAEAASLLREALLKEPQRSDLNLKLLEVLGLQGDSAAYSEHENSLHEAGYSAEVLEQIRARSPKLASAQSLATLESTAETTAEPAASVGDEFQLNLDDLSMDSSWDLACPSDTTAAIAEPVDQLEPLDDGFLDDFADASPPLELEPLSGEFAVPAHEEIHPGKLEEAQNCIDDGDLDSAIALLNELLKDSDESLKQTARSLLASIR
ncbi:MULTISPECIES: FimV/HubP family polar landmark protein [unclassified Pseudomonas]|uniref:FimV/HubP family polar landmark protein n=1 Tax=unclassified Pseudomonas TaxID=196821 RepID=UPI000CD32062|nr:MULTISPECIES: FimV/HubP family polar landmark protein [unclassified Pseudomonas]POA32551.1 peptidoglycan-binding protein LysM [Pseudomonas sp. GW456-R21]POA68182.1 peptidoglycan-binding protein LysM [Pseudomonas sp. GW460-R15]